MTTEQAKVLYICLVVLVGMGVVFWIGLTMGRMGSQLEIIEKRRKKINERH